MTETNNLKLNKFEATDNFDYTKLNENADTIDRVVSNPNLLDNAWFTINQRGSSSYIGSFSKPYTFDRWQIYDDSDGYFTISKNENCITLSKSGANGSYIQNFIDEEVTKTLLGKKVTISLMNSDGEVVKSEGVQVPYTFTSWLAISEKQIDGGWWFGVAFYTSNKMRFYITTKGERPSSDISIISAKLELGSVSTLANDSAPNYATELLKCQRYFQVISPYRFQCYYMDGNAICFTTNLVTALRTTPSVIIASGMKIHVNSREATGFTFSYRTYFTEERGSQVFIQATKTSHGVSYDSNVTLTWDGNLPITLSADL